MRNVKDIEYNAILKDGMMERPEFVDKPGIDLEKPIKNEKNSGFLIIQLEDQYKALNFNDLNKVASEYKLAGLHKILDEYDIDNNRRVVKSLDPEKLLALETKAMRTKYPPLQSLTQYWKIDLRHCIAEMDGILKQIIELVEVKSAYRELTVSDPVVTAGDETYAGGQGYLDAAPDGIDARWAWTQDNCEGAGIGFIDLEQGWFLNHEDYVAKNPTLIYGDNMDGVGDYIGNHGTAVLGEVLAQDNGLGVIGIAPSVTSVNVTSHYDSGIGTNGHVADAIVAAIPNLNPGDVLLLEVQRNFYPTETDDADFNAIRLAIAHGIIVVEAAGNGNNDIDAYTNASGDNILDRSDADFRESGAIMIGACEEPLPHDRWRHSNYGSRIDCFAWGENVTTCGYGDLDNGGGDNDETYTNTFQGTSSASPIIVGAAIIIQGLYESTLGTRLSPGQMRVLLSDPATGTAQGGGRGGNISVMPDLRAIIENALNLVPDVYVRDNIGDDGSIPSTGSISASPDVIIRPSQVANPEASFGEGSGTENSYTIGYEVEAGQDNYIYVRMKNRGTNDAHDVTATLYWSEVSTLITPDMWNLIGTTTPTDVPQGDTLVVTEPLTWEKENIPATGHYCIVAILDHPQDPAPPLPPSTTDFDWDAFRAFIRNYNNVTWRNFNVVDLQPNLIRKPIELPFIIVGAPDRIRRFDFEIIFRLPKGPEIWIELPQYLGMKVIKENNWKYKIDRKMKKALIRLPPARSIPIKDVDLPKGGKFKSKFILKGANKLNKGGNSISIRQIFRGEEVGRVTWQFESRQIEKPKLRKVKFL